ncbi:hypothetical protein CEXT_204341 [Caerostris extrusa]|uniref:Uncharacterized protein n=1 Tax=Caerostris extrusa TaxID=172846 RepID=A0AAV4SH19_CAEEX|nr:hypothetical protein CEXT_204341 [Caerostris extrusa]
MGKAEDKWRLSFYRIAQFLKRKPYWFHWSCSGDGSFNLTTVVQKNQIPEEEEIPNILPIPESIEIAKALTGG